MLKSFVPDLEAIILKSNIISVAQIASFHAYVSVPENLLQIWNTGFDEPFVAMKLGSNSAEFNPLEPFYDKLLNVKKKSANCQRCS